jgi:hypothetical protein
MSNVSVTMFPSFPKALRLLWACQHAAKYKCEESYAFFNSPYSKRLAAARTPTTSVSSIFT